MIRVTDLTKYYQDFLAVDHISFEIKAGEIVGLLGPNGAGKSTTLRMLTGYMSPSSGHIDVKGYSIYDNPLQIKQSLGYLPESSPLYHDMLTYDYLKFSARIKGLNKEQQEKRIEELCDLCELKAVMHKPVGALSKGYRQRVGMAHAMMSNPDVLILDEPTSGLDPNQIIEIRSIIKRIGQEKTIILSTHILSEAEAVCDRVIIINHGKIAADDSIENLKSQALNTKIIHAALTGLSEAQVDEMFRDLPGLDSLTLGTDAETRAVEAKLMLKTKDDLRAGVYELIKNSGAGLLEFRQEIRSLENIFIELTREN